MRPLDPDQLRRLTQTAGSTAVTRAKAGWTVDYNELGVFCDRIELIYPVAVRFSSSYRTSIGTHRFYGGGHKITVSQIFTAETSNNTLLHELAHCLQQELYESIGNDIHTFHAHYLWNKQMYESDANAFAKKYVEEGVRLLR